jgi:hypothetical protein
MEKPASITIRATSEIIAACKQQVLRTMTIDVRLLNADKNNT